MLKYFRNILDFLLFSNVYIALGAAAQVAFSYELLGLKPDLNLTGLVFFATLALYNFSTLLAKPKQAQQSPFKRIRWVFAHERLFISLSILAILGLGTTFLFISNPSKLLLGLLGLIAIGYNLPLLQFRQKGISLRNIPGVKIFIIAGVWTLSTLLLPLLEWEQQSSNSISLSETLILLLQRFFLVMAITIPFDIRDLYQDKLYNLRTIPAYLGEAIAYRLSQLLLLATVILGLLSLESKVLLALIVTCGIAAWLIFKAKGTKNEHYYFLYLDGLLLLPWLLLQVIGWAI
jgi:4-hydroxybenzoate polyprenyltransferase